MLNLKLVTFEGDNTQFLVNATTNEEAIAYANEANIHCGVIDNEDGCAYDLNNPKAEWYTIEDVDWDMLQEICKRDDYMFSTGRAVVYND